MTIKLGDKAKDRLTGFEGYVTAKAEYLGGCIRYELIAFDDPSKEFWFDSDRLECKPEKPEGFRNAPPSRDP